MAAGGSRINTNSRGAKSGRGAVIRREDRAPLPSRDPYIPGIDETLGRTAERVAAGPDRADILLVGYTGVGAIGSALASVGWLGLTVIQATLSSGALAGESLRKIIAT